MQPSSWTGLVRRQLSPQAVTGVTDSIGQGGKKAGDAIKQSAAKLSTTQLIMVVVFSLLLFAGSILACWYGLALCRKRKRDKRVKEERMGFL